MNFAKRGFQFENSVGKVIEKQKSDNQNYFTPEQHMKAREPKRRHHTGLLNHNNLTNPEESLQGRFHSEGGASFFSFSSPCFNLTEEAAIRTINEESKSKV